MESPPPKKDLFFEPIKVHKRVDEGTFVALQQAYMFNENIDENKDDVDEFRTNSGLSTIYDVSYVELSPDKKTLSIGIEQRKSVPINQVSTKEGQVSLQPVKPEIEQLVKLIQKYRSMKAEKTQKGFSFGSYLSKFSNQTYAKKRLKQICEDLDGQAFVVIRLGIDETRDTFIQKQQVISNTYLTVSGRNIVQEAVIATQTKTLPQYHTKYNYKKEVEHILRHCIKRMEKPVYQGYSQEKPSFVFEVDKRLKMANGDVVPVKAKLYVVNPLLYYMIEEIQPSFELKKQIEKPVAGEKLPSSSNPKISFYDLFQTEPYAGYKTIQQDGSSNIEIITKVHKQ